MCPAGWKPGSDTVSIAEKDSWSLASVFQWLIDYFKLMYMVQVNVNRLQAFPDRFSVLRRRGFFFCGEREAGRVRWPGSAFVTTLFTASTEYISFSLCANDINYLPQIIPDPSGKLKYFDKLNWSASLPLECVKSITSNPNKISFHRKTLYGNSCFFFIWPGDRANWQFKISLCF